MLPWLARSSGVLIAAALMPLMRLSGRQAGLVLAYHAVDTRQGDPEREIVPPIDRRRFDRHVRYVRRWYEPVSAEDFPRAVSVRRRGARFPVCITLDDDLPQHVRHALPIVRDHSVPATFFLSGASLSEPRSFWWERLQRAADQGSTPSEMAQLLPSSSLPTNGRRSLRAIASAIQALPPDQRHRLDIRLLDLAGPDPPTAGIRRDDVLALCKSGATIGFHTRDHDDLAQLTPEDLPRALREGREDLEELTGTRLNLIAYPHGSANRGVAEAAREAGFRIGFTGTRCATTGSSDPLLLGRIFADSKASVGELATAMIGTLLVGPRCERTPAEC